VACVCVCVVFCVCFVSKAAHPKTTSIIICVDEAALYSFYLGYMSSAMRMRLSETGLKVASACAFALAVALAVTCTQSAFDLWSRNSQIQLQEEEIDAIWQHGR
jgi:hypothetical protein